MNEKEAFEKASLEPCRLVMPVKKYFEAGWQAALEWAKQGQEPRYWVHDFGDEDGGTEFFDHPTGSDCSGCVPLYLHPAPAQPVRLSDREIVECWNQVHIDAVNLKIDFANAIMDAMLAKGAGQAVAAVNDLKHDLEQHVHISNKQAQEIVDLNKVNYQLIQALESVLLSTNHKSAIHIAGEALVKYKEASK